MITIRGYYEDDRIQLLEPVPDAAKVGRRTRVAVLFLDTDETSTQAAQYQFRDWADDDNSREQAALLNAIREELAPYTIQAMKTAVESEEDWEALLG